MATLFIRHNVKDFAAWKDVYDSLESRRSELGVTGQGVYQADGDPNDVKLYHHFENMEVAKAFIANPEWKTAMEKAGVVGAPDIWLGTRI